MIDKETLDSYRRGVDSGVMKSATPNVVRQLLNEIEQLKELLRYLLVEWVFDHELEECGESGWPEDSMVEEAKERTGTPEQWGEEGKE